MAIRREITVTRKGLNSPIDIVHETNLLPFEFVVTDFAIPSASIAVVYVESASSNVKKQLCEINDNVISFTPEATLFDEGKNILQLRVTHDEKNLFSFSETVNCSGKIVTGDEEEATSQPTLVEQLLTDVANTNEKVDNALQEVEDTKQAFEDLSPQFAYLWLDNAINVAHGEPVVFDRSAVKGDTFSVSGGIVTVEKDIRYVRVSATIGGSSANDRIWMRILRNGARVYDSLVEGVYISAGGTTICSAAKGDVFKVISNEDITARGGGVGCYFNVEKIC